MPRRPPPGSTGAAASARGSRAMRSASSRPSSVPPRTARATSTPSAPVSRRRSTGRSGCLRTRSSSRTPRPRRWTPSARSWRSTLPSATRWVESLSPWPADGFGTERMRCLLRGLGDPQERFPAIHVVGTNGKSTTTRLTETLLLDAGLSVGAYLSPHVVSWQERIRLNGAESDLETALTGVRPRAEALSATQFEALTAAALLAFADAGVDVAVAEAEWRELAEENGAGLVVVTGRSNLALAVAAAESFLGRPVDPHAGDEVTLPGRLEWRGESPLEIWDGAHNLAAVGWLLPRLPAAPLGGWTVVSSILRDKRPGMMLEALSVLGPTLVATESTNGRALPAPELAALASAHFDRVEWVPEPVAARALALDIAGADGALLVTGSLYLLADLSGDDRDP